MTPTLTECLAQMGAAGKRLDAIHACEAGAGNISVALRTASNLATHFPKSETYTLPAPAAALVGWTVLVTGSGCRLRDVADAPTANVAAVEIGPDGLTGTLHYGPGRAYKTPTSEFNSHLAVHADQVAAGGAPNGHHTVVHAQPPYLVLLTHGPAADSREFSRELLRWEPETVVQLPEGVKVLEFMVPGSARLQEASVAGLRTHRIVLWSKHGLMTRSADGPLKAVDLIEYAETGAMYAHLNRARGSPREGLSDGELAAVIAAFNVPTDLF
ncbi:MAG: class II aldolase/adducin family protein [Propionibacteriaceae bacterium]|jgi:rhamnulose-1-phosphate aldolase|nr:class II aldolase/adducin family protein [Propionibacteriaceae bacterium]